jgi:hypothetical protein
MGVILLQSADSLRYHGKSGVLLDVLLTIDFLSLLAKIHNRTTLDKEAENISTKDQH